MSEFVKVNEYTGSPVETMNTENDNFILSVNEYTGESAVLIQSSIVEKAKKLFKNNWGKILAIICSYILGVFGSETTKETFDKTLNQTMQLIELVSSLKSTDKTANE